MDANEGYFEQLAAEQQSSEPTEAPREHEQPRPRSSGHSQQQRSRERSAPRRVVTVAASEIKMERTEWLWNGRVPLGEVTLLAGLPGLGKSMLTVWLAAQNSLGLLNGPPGTTLIATAEDSPERTVVPRLKAWQADLSRVRFVHICEGDDPLYESISLPTDTDALRHVAEEVGANLIVLDPLMAHLEGGVDSYRDQAVRQALNPLYYLARDLVASVVVLLHLNKNPGSDPLLRMGGSMGLPAAARSALLMARDPNDLEGDQGSSRVVAHAKCNVGPYAPSLLFEIMPMLLLETETEPRIETARIEERGECDLSGSDLLGSSPSTTGTKAAEAELFLREQLGDGPRPNDEVKSAAERAGISEKTLRRAREKLGVVIAREASGHTTWALPDDPGDLRAHGGAQGHRGQEGHEGHEGHEAGADAFVPPPAPTGHEGPVPLFGEAGTEGAELSDEQVRAEVRRVFGEGSPEPHTAAELAEARSLLRKLAEEPAA